MTSRDETIEAIAEAIQRYDDKGFYVDRNVRAAKVYDLHVAPLERERDALRAALATVMAETGTSSLAHHAARDALAALDARQEDRHG